MIPSANCSRVLKGSPPRLLIRPLNWLITATGSSPASIRNFTSQLIAALAPIPNVSSSLSAYQPEIRCRQRYAQLHQSPQKSHVQYLPRGPYENPFSLDISLFLFSTYSICSKPVACCTSLICMAFAAASI